MKNLAAFFAKDRVGLGITNREIAVLDVVNSYSETGICASDITSVFREKLGKEPRLSTVYSKILSLEKKGLVSNSGTSSPSLMGRKRNLFSVTNNGKIALQLCNNIRSSEISLER